SIIEHKGNMYYLEFREDYLIICKNCKYIKPTTSNTKSKASPYCKALILAVMESWTNDKRGKGQDLGVYMTYPQWIESMYGMFGRTAIIDSLDELIGEKLISREAHRMYGKDTYLYYLNYKEVNKRMKALEDRDPNITRPLVDPSTNKRVESTSKRVTHPQVNANPSTSGHNIESTNNLNLNTTNKHNVIDFADAEVSTTSRSSKNIIPLSEENKPEEKTIIAEEQQPLPPTSKEIAPRRPVATAKNKRSKKDEAKDLLKVGAFAAPQKPDPATHQYNGELFMELADYYRGSTLPESSQPHSNYMKAVMAATRIVQRRTPFEVVDTVFCFLLGRGAEIGKPWLRDENWIAKGYNTDLWSVENNINNKALEIQRLELQQKATNAVNSVTSHLENAANTDEPEQEETVLWSHDIEGLRRWKQEPRNKELRSKVFWEMLPVSEARQLEWKRMYSFTPGDRREILNYQKKQAKTTTCSA
ncbi:MAG TPA: hypothetical protein VL461_06225, partial [Dictyobacter sp.]|nr:hypothetical protein [Dictyobacter sp.]